MEIPGHPACRVFASKFQKGGRLWGAPGGVELTLPGTVQELVTLEEDRGHVGLLYEEESELQIALLDERGRVVQALELEDSWPESSHSLALAREQNLVWALFLEGEGIPALRRGVRGERVKLS
jgi:hypothetical protein